MRAKQFGVFNNGGLGCCRFKGGGSDVVNLLFVGGLCLSLHCYAFLCVHSSFAIILKSKRKLVVLLLLFYSVLLL